ncbi:MAG TPA: ankyrin repeat domain-containing protein [Anaerovoracaceae bacterium]|nr:ankyrin repeat domain-containing protein [Anaerovoracaceae bacterium]
MEDDDSVYLDYSEKYLYDIFRYGDIPAIEEFFEDGGSADVSLGDNPAIIVAIGGCFAFNGTTLEVIKILVEHGADVNAMGFLGRTPLHIVAIDYARNKSFTPELTTLLVQSGADVKAKDKYGESVLDIARRHGAHEIVQLIESLEEKEKLEAQVAVATKVGKKVKV